MDNEHHHKRNFHKQVVTLLGLLQVQAGEAVKWRKPETAESQLLRSYYHQLLDACVLPILQSWCLDKGSADMVVRFALSKTEVAPMKANNVVAQPHFVDELAILSLL